MSKFVLRAVGPKESVIWRLDAEYDAKHRFAYIKAGNGIVPGMETIRYAVLSESVDSKYVMRDEWFAGNI